MDDNAFKQFRHTQIAELRPYIKGEDLSRVSISAEDAAMGSPKQGDMIARNPANHADQWLVSAKYFAANFEPLNDQPARKETSPRVSSIAAGILRMKPMTVSPDREPVREFNDLLEKAKTVAGSALSQDETPGQQELVTNFFTRLKDEREDLDWRLAALNSYGTRNPGHPNPHHHEMLKRQAGHMNEYLAVLDEHIADIEMSRRAKMENDHAE